MARTPNFDRLWAAYPHTLLRTDGPFVGLPDGQMGNSEVGHLNIGAGTHRANGHHPHRRGDRLRSDL